MYASTILRALLTHLILTAALGSLVLVLASVHRDVELFVQDRHSKWPGQELNQGLFDSRGHAPNLYMTPLVFAYLGFQAHRSLLSVRQ